MRLAYVSHQQLLFAETTTLMIPATRLPIAILSSPLIYNTLRHLPGGRGQTAREGTRSCQRLV